MANVLLLEPDNLLAGSIKRYFARAKHRVFIHSDPQAAIIQADKHLPDVVITELQLAGRSGIEFLYEFRSYPDWQNIPVIVLSGLHQEHLQAYSEAFKELNVCAALYKPLTGLKQLLDAAEHSRQPAAA
jgi:DNA-binding response OmpR family regulator